MGQPTVELLEKPLDRLADTEGASRTALRLGDGIFATRRETPSSVSDLCACVAQCAGENLGIYPQGGRTSLDFGGVPARPGLIINTLELSKVIDYPAADMTITVESGMTLAALQAILDKQNQYLPIDPPQSDQASLGGVMATGWTGPRRFSAMRPRDQLIGIGFVNGLGTLIRGGGRVVKNVAGYDFPKLLTGSMGSLGILTELTFKVRPKPESTAIAWVPVRSAEEVGSFLDRLNLSATRPTALEVLNHPAANKIGSPLGLKPGDYVVAIGFDDTAKSIRWQCETILNELPQGVSAEICLDSSARSIWHALTENYAQTEARLSVRIVTRPSRLAELLADIDSAVWNIQAHAGQGIATLSTELDRSLAAVEQDLARWASKVAPSGGCVSLPICPTGWKPHLKIWGDPKPDWSIMAGIKAALDPNQILNPGRLIGLS